MSLRTLTTRAINALCQDGASLYYPHPDLGFSARVLGARTKNGITQLRLYWAGASQWFDASYSRIETKDY